jgi:general secretion pathway protein E
MPRKLCVNCREPVEPDPGTLAKLKIGAEHAGPWYAPVGCEACLNTGYRGRTGIFGMLILTDPVKSVLRQDGATPEALRKAAGEAALRTMYQDGIGKVVAGITTLSEIQRVLQRRRTGEEKK